MSDLTYRERKELQEQLAKLQDRFFAVTHDVSKVPPMFVDLLEATTTACEVEIYGSRRDNAEERGDKKAVSDYEDLILQAQVRSYTALFNFYDKYIKN